MLFDYGGADVDDDDDDDDIGTSQGLSVANARRRQFDDIGEVNLGQNAGVTRDQLEQLRQDIRTGLNDTLFTRLHNMEEVQSLS